MHKKKIRAAVFSGSPMFKAVMSLGVGGLLIATSILWAQSVTHQPSKAEHMTGANPTDSSLGITLFASHCAMCHNGTNERAPSRESLEARTPEAIYEALTTGPMQPMANGLTELEKRQIAVFISGKPFGAAQAGNASLMMNRCAARPMEDPVKHPEWNGWGVGPHNSRFQPASEAGLTPEQIPNLQLKWAFGFPDAVSSWGQPTVAGGRVFVGSDNDYVYSLNAKTGCVFWSFEAKAGVRTAVTIGPGTPGKARYNAYFGDVKGNVYAVNAETGTLLWTQHADPHPLARITGSPTLAGNRLYVPVSSLEELAGGNPSYQCCTFRGSIVAYDAQTGKEIWKAYTISQPAKPTRKNSEGTQLWGPAGASIWTAPVVDREHHVIYATTGDAYTSPAAATSDAVIAFDMDTGKRLWFRQFTPGDVYVRCWLGHGKWSDNCPARKDIGPDVDFAAPPILQKLPNGRSILLLGQTNGVVYAVDPDKQGKLLWERRIASPPPGARKDARAGIMWGFASDQDTGFFNLTTSEGRRRVGAIAAVRLTDGHIEWITPEPPGNCGTAPRCNSSETSPVTAIAGVVFAGATDGRVYAYSARDGKILWSYETGKEFQTVNGVKARGGSVSGAGPTVAGGMLFVPSGYAELGRGRPGNLLLAFAVGKSEQAGSQAKGGSALSAAH